MRPYKKSERLRREEEAKKMLENVRISGESRYETAAKISKLLPASRNAIIVSSSSFSDALVSSSLAKELNAPILQADKSLPRET